MNIKRYTLTSLRLVPILLATLAACSGSAPAKSTVAPATPQAGLANPASVFCAEKGGKVNITTDASGGQIGVCVFPDGSQCEEWAFYRGQCTPVKPSQATTTTPAAGPASLTEAVLKNAKYELPDIGATQLKDGSFEHKYGDGATQVNKVGYTQAVLGDLNGDKADDAAVILWANTGGSGTFIYLVAAVNQNGAPQQVTAQLLGDRVKVQNLAVQNGQIVINVLSFGQNDPMCCPSQLVIRTYRLEGGTLKVVSEVKPTAGANVSILQPSQIRLDTQGLPYSWQAVSVPATPYDASQPPGPVGLPEHIEILFGAAKPADRQPGMPVMYIIPVDAYRQLWDSNGNPSVSSEIAKIHSKAVALPSPASTSGWPALPVEEVGGYNDLAVQVARVTSNANSASKSGYRLVGRWLQDANPVTNQGLKYVYQGFTNDGKYLVAFFYPVTTSALPRTAAQVSADEMAKFTANPTVFLQQKAAELNALPPTAWDPDLTKLDALVGSLQIEGI